MLWNTYDTLYCACTVYIKNVCSIGTYILCMFAMEPTFFVCSTLYCACTVYIKNVCSIGTYILCMFAMEHTFFVWFAMEHTFFIYTVHAQYSACYVCHSIYGLMVSIYCVCTVYIKNVCSVASAYLTCK